MGDARSSSAPAAPDELRARVRVPYLRKASAGATVPWFPPALIFVAIDAAGWSLGT